MFLTRMGRDAKFVITGDASQVDLPRKQRSGLSYAQQALNGTDGLRFISLTGEDVIRHRLVQAVIKAFEATDAAIEQEERAKALARKEARMAANNGSSPSEKTNSTN